MVNVSPTVNRRATRHLLLPFPFNCKVCYDKVCFRKDYEEQMKIAVVFVCLFALATCSAPGSESERILGEQRLISGFKADQLTIKSDFAVYDKDALIAKTATCQPLTSWHRLDFNTDDKNRYLFLLTKDDIEVPQRRLYIVHSADGRPVSYKPSCNNYDEMFFFNEKGIYYWCEYLCRTKGIVERIDVSDGSSHDIKYPADCASNAVLDYFKAQKITFARAIIPE